MSVVPTAKYKHFLSNVGKKIVVYKCMAIISAPQRINILCI